MWPFDKQENIEETGSPEPVTEASKLSKDDIAALARLSGFTDKDLENDELMDEVRKNATAVFDQKNDDNFMDFWDQAGFVNQTSRNVSTEQERKARYAQYEFMIANSSEISLALKTYIEEALSPIKEEEDFFRITVEDAKTGTKDKADTSFVNDVLKRSSAFGNIRSLIGNLCMYGDSFYRIEELKGEAEDSKNSSDYKLSGYYLLDPIDAERTNIPGRDIPFKFKHKLPGRQQGKDLPSWEMIHYRIATSRKDIKPYGEILLESVRSTFKRLLIVEALLALTRASRVERLIVKIPTNTDNPDVMLTKLIRWKSLAKNIVLGSSSKLTAEKKNIAFTDMLFIPKGRDAQSSFEIDTLKPAVDLGDIADVEYFQDKVTNGLTLPRGYLKSDDAYMGYRKLALQDLRLSRTINGVFRSIAEGHTLLAKIILFRAGRWTEDKVVSTSYIPPAPIASEQLGALREALEVITQMIDMVAEKDPDTGETIPNPAMVRELMLKVARMPESAVNLVFPPNKGKDKKKPEESLTVEEVKKRIAVVMNAAQEEKVTSESLRFVDRDKVPSLKMTAVRTVTEEMLV